MTIAQRLARHVPLSKLVISDIQRLQVRKPPKVHVVEGNKRVPTHVQGRELLERAVLDEPKHSTLVAQRLSPFYGRIERFGVDFGGGLEPQGP